MKWKRDWQLYGRMAASLGSLAILYIAFIATLVHLSGYLWVIIAAFGALALIQYYYGDAVTLKSIGASKVDANTYPDLHSRITRLSQQVGLPLPDIAVADIDAPNAFAIGRNQAAATVCVTTGLLDTVEGDELDAVLAHELTHVKNRDVMVLTVVSFLTTITYAIVRHAWFFDGGGSSGGSDGGNHWLLAFFVVTFVAWVGSYLLTRLLSRYREYAADRGAAMITGKPAAMASALDSISTSIDDQPSEDLREKASMNALFIIPADAESRILNLMNTHPKTDRRIEQLKGLEREMNQS